MPSIRIVSIALAALGAGASQESSRAGGPLARRYRDGEKTTYHMAATNKDLHRDLSYEVDAVCTVKKNAEGLFVEESEWTGLVVNQKPVQLPTGKDAIHQTLSRDPAFKLGIPDLSKVPPMLIGPITDLLTFYADLSLAGREGKLGKAGDHFYFKLGTPSSWADGATVCVGEDSIDFDVSLSDVNESTGVATTVVKHVPPERPQIRKVADWTSVPVAGAENNWIQVVKIGADGYLGQVGKETFDVTLTTRLDDGRLQSATLDNVVEVVERPSRKPDLSSPGPESRYRIVRKIELKESRGATAPAK